ERALYSGRAAKAQQGRNALFRRQHHHHLAAFELRLGLDLGDLADLLAHALEKLHAELQVRHLASAEAQRQLDLVALVEEAAHRLHLGLIIVVVDVGTHLDLLDLDGLLALASLGGLLLALIFHLAEVGDLAHRRLGVGHDLDKIHAGVFRGKQRIIDRNDATVHTLGIDKLHLRNANLEICARPFLDRGCGSVWSANGRSLLESLTRLVVEYARARLAARSARPSLTHERKNHEPLERVASRAQASPKWSPQG